MRKTGQPPVKIAAWAISVENLQQEGLYSDVSYGLSYTGFYG